MALSTVEHGDVVALGYDSATNERGYLVKMINRTGHASVKGELVACSTATDREVILQANEYDTVGAVEEAGVAEASEMWVWMLGSVCQVLYKENTASTRGNILVADAVNGRASDIANPGGGLPGTDTHFTECGHVLQSVAAGGAGVSNLVLAILHFN
jgi:hypothetical protein